MSGANHLFSDYWWMLHLEMIRNQRKEITGFEVDDGWVMYLRFNKSYKQGLLLS